MPKEKGGLEGIVAATSSITKVDGDQGRLFYAGIDIRELAARSTFEETAYLLWYGRLPTRLELDDLERRLSSMRELPPDISRMIVEFTSSWDAMETLRTMVSALSGYDSRVPDEIRKDHGRAIMLTAQMPLIVASYHWARNGLEPVSPRQDLNTAANLLYMITGKEPSEKAVRALDICLIVHADHELNASTFAGRVAASTLADIYGAVTAAIATLDGPLHGGANEDVMRMLEEVGDPSRAEQYIMGLLSQGKKVPGFGHRVYRTYDPRAAELRDLARELVMESGEAHLWKISHRIEEIMDREKPGIHANLDYISALVYHAIGIPTHLFTPVFACSRVVGWTAHIVEQYANNRLIRPVADYVGPTNVSYVPLDERDMAKAA